MSTQTPFEIFLSVPPGLEHLMRAEAKEAGFPDPQITPGGVTFQGGWPDVWRANLVLRGAGRVLARIGGFPVFHLAQLDKRARKFDWGAVLRPDVPLRVEVTCRRSKVYHDRAAKQRIENALTEVFGATLSAEAPLVLKARIEDDFCSFSLDTSGESLHKRGHKEAVGKAPMRENMAALFLRACGYDGSQAVLDPMCGSGTFPIEAAEIASGLQPGRAREFAFERLVGFDPAAFAALKTDALAQPALRYFGRDRDEGAVRMATANAARAGVSDCTDFQRQTIAELTAPDVAPGLVMVNPPYGARIGNKKQLFALYGSFGKVMQERFRGWRVGMVTSEYGLAKVTGLPWRPERLTVPHGGLKITLYKTDPL
jgi:putative N6-adenine-specific DNA methylase